ncbi:ATP-binding protein [Paenibacillus xylanilyticus]|nr:ATP-binding protein [Paenibacillus xylanilyticus]
MGKVLRELNETSMAIDPLQPVRSTTSLFAANEFEGTYSCLGCKKTITRTLLSGDVLGGRWGLNKACSCVEAEREAEEKERVRKYRRGQLEKIYARSILNETLKQASFDSFQPRPGTENVFKAALNFYENFESKKQGVMFYGPPGNGKSHLAAAIHHKLNQDGWVCLFLDVPQLFNLAKDTYKQGSKVTLSDIIRGAAECDLLTLDELGSGALTETEFKDILFPIINARQGKLTNFTTNLDLNRLEQWFARDKKGSPLDKDGRLFDRILGSVDIYENQGTSKRREDALRRMRGEA